MIKSITIKNFQSHKNTELLFSDGVNTIIGSSDQGKSAVLRALLWCAFNRPLGVDSIISHWARDKKNKIADTMYVKLETENGIVTRSRAVDANEYILNDKKEKPKLFSAINKDVPLDIQKFFNLSEVNIQQQHDAPFLLSQSSGDVAKYFNKIVRLDVIDTVLGNAESARRETNKKIKETEKEKKEYEKQLEDFIWIENAQELSEKITKVDERINSYDDLWQVIDCEIQDYLIQKKFLSNFPDVKKANTIIEKIENLKIDYDLLQELESSIEKYKEVNRDRKIFEMIKSGKDLLSEIEVYERDNAGLNADIKLLQKDIDEYAENKKLADLGFDKKKVSNLIKDIEAIQPDYNLFRVLNSQIQEYEAAIKNGKQAENEITDLKEQLPDICPECGQSLKDCEDE